MLDTQHYEGTINCPCGREFIFWTKQDVIYCAACGEAHDVTKCGTLIDDISKEGG